MQLLTLLWALAAGACLTVALVHLGVFLGRRQATAHAFLALAAIGAAGNAIVELLQLHATRVETFALAIRWQHLAILAVVVGLVWLVRVQLQAGRLWLAWLQTAGWSLVLILNVFLPYSIVYEEITRLERVALPWGETFSVAVGSPHVLKQLPDLFIPLFLLFVADATRTAWRRGDRRGALAVGGSILVFVGFSGVHAPLVDYGIVRTPYLITFAFLAVVIATGVELSRDVVRAASLASEVEANERRWRLLLENVKLLVLGLDRQGRVDYANPFFRQSTGFELGEIHGRPFTVLIPEARLAEIPASFEDMLRRGLPASAEGWLRTRSGDERIVAWSMVTLPGPTGPAGLISIGADITEQRQAERARDESARRTAAALQEVESLKQRLEAEVVYLQSEVYGTGGFPEIVGDSDALRYVLSRVEQVAPLDTTVLIEGETGVGKELIARAIHAHSRRRERTLVSVNCATLPPNLIEAELFGHERGAFTGAVRSRPGRFEIANGGTLFLDEIADLPLELQAKLLRAIQEGEVARVGSDRTSHVDVRFIAATNKKLSEEVTRGRFREDLFYRLCVFPLTVPPLRQRKDDIPLLVRRFVDRLARAQRKSITRIPQPVIDELRGYDWPGNVRELESVLERAVITTTGDTLRLAGKLVAGTEPSEKQPGSRYRGTLAEVEREYVLGVLEECAWRIEGSGGGAERLGLHPNTLRFRMQKLGITRPASSST